MKLGIKVKTSVFILEKQFFMGKVSALPPENRQILPREKPSGFSPITVKIVRAHGGCLGTKSR
jgi:hypothetical protein